MIRFDQAALLDPNGLVLSTSLCTAHMDINDHAMIVVVDRMIDFPPVDRDGIATWVVFYQESPGQLRVATTVASLMQSFSAYSMRLGDSFRIYPYDR